jgi:hypothetical protein
MNEEKIVKNIETLAGKSAESEKSEDAVRFSQAANNLANTWCAVTAAMSNINK